MWKYDVTSDTWSHQSDVPVPVGAGGSVSSPNIGGAPEGTLDVMPGGGSSTVWSLDIAANSWKQIDNAPAPVSRGGALSSQVNGCDFAFAGGDSDQFFSTGVMDCHFPFFSLTLAQSTIETTRRNTIQAELEISRTDGFTGPVTISPQTDLPKGIKILSGPAVVAGDSTPFPIKIKSKARLGSYSIEFSATDAFGDLQTAILTLVVQKHSKA